MTDIIIIKNADEETIRRILKEQNQETKDDEATPPISRSLEERKKLITKNLKTETTKNKRGMGYYWNKTEDKIIKTAYTNREDGRIDWEMLKKELPLRTAGSIMRHARDMKVTNKHRKHKGYKHKGEDKRHLWNKKEDAIVKETYNKTPNEKIDMK